MADWTAITGIVVSGVVGPSFGAAWGMRRLAREHDNARMLADRADLRALLDTATEQLSRAARLTGALESLIFTHGHAIGTNAQTHFDRLGDALRAVDLNDGRLAIRLGSEHAVARAHHRIFEALVMASDGGFELRQLGRYAEGTDVKESLAKVRSGMAEYRSAHAEYMAEAHTLAGARLSPVHRRLPWRSSVSGPNGHSPKPVVGEPVAECVRGGDALAP